MRTKQWPSTLSRAQTVGDEAEVTIATPARDLMRDTIDVINMDTQSYMAGPRAVNFAHNWERLPIAQTLTLAKSPTGIRARFRWRQDPDSQAVKSAFDDGVLGASVEFMVPDGGAIPNSHGGFYFKRTILTGWALTGNPANPACIKVFKALGWARPTVATARPFTLEDIAAALRAQRIDDEVRAALAQRSQIVAEVVHRATVAELRGIVEPVIDRAIARARGRIE